MKKLLLSAAILTALFSCSKEEINVRKAEERTETQFSISAQDGTRFKAIVQYGIGDLLDTQDTLNTQVYQSSTYLLKGEELWINVQSDKPMKVFTTTKGVQYTYLLKNSETIKINK